TPESSVGDGVHVPCPSTCSAIAGPSSGAQVAPIHPFGAGPPPPAPPVPGLPPAPELPPAPVLPASPPPITSAPRAPQPASRSARIIHARLRIAPHLLSGERRGAPHTHAPRCPCASARASGTPLTSGLCLWLHLRLWRRRCAAWAPDQNRWLFAAPRGYASR